MKPEPRMPWSSGSPEPFAQNLSAAEEIKTGGARAFTRDPKATLREAIKLRQDYRRQARTPEQYRERGRLIRQKPDRELGDRRLKDPDNQQRLDGIGLRHDNGRVLLFWSIRRLSPPTTAPNGGCAEP